MQQGLSTRQSPTVKLLQTGVIRDTSSSSNVHMNHKTTLDLPVRMYNAKCTMQYTFGIAWDRRLMDCAMRFYPMIIKSMDEGTAN